MINVNLDLYQIKERRMESIGEKKTDDTFSDFAVRFERGTQDGQDEPTISIQVNFLLTT